MDKEKTVEVFEKSVKNKFNLYNSLFLNLPYSNVEHVGTLIPILERKSREGLEKGLDPIDILDSFFHNQTNLKSEQEQIDFMFRVIQYVERQVVLFDSVEDAALPYIRELGDDLTIKDFFHHPNSINRFREIEDKMADFSARIVFTAHPTQFYPPRVLDIMARLRSMIKVNDIEQIDITLRQLGLTSLLNPEKPSPFQEAKNIIYFLRNVYYDAVGELYTEIRNTLPSKKFDNPGVIRLGFWPGGDRDGNPFVTYKTTMAVADELRMALMKCYYRDITKLEHLLTFTKVEEKIKELKDHLYDAMFDASIVFDHTKIMKPLEKVRQIVDKNYNGLYMDEINHLIDKVSVFKTHFATLDIRQNHDVHENAVELILKNAGIIRESIEELSEDELNEILLHKNLKIDMESIEDAIIKDTLQIMQRIPEIQSKNGEEGCNRYIISHSEDTYAVLFVFALLKWSIGKEQEINVDIIPLFESMEGMAHSGKIMQKLFETPGYRTHLERRNNTQTIMLGFSDGTKDGGYFKANWSIFKTKEKLTAVCSRYGIKAVFFDGRGGPPARGGGRTHRFYAAQTDKIANREIQLTIQGQTISSKFGTKEHFKHNSEQLLTASLYNSFFSAGNAISKEQRNLIEQIAELSFEKYSALKNHEKFLPYLENRSTLKYYGQTNIGSRPAKRGKKKKLDLSDLRAISYVGSWSQLKQNVPGYFGIGTALKELADREKTNELKKLFSDVPFFKALMQNSMMSLSKCYFELTSYLDDDKSYSDFWNILFEEYKLSKKMLLLISGYTMLMEEEPVSRKSVAIREKIVLPLLIIQQYALQKIEQGAGPKEVWEKIVKRSLYGNVNAARNSA